MHLALIEQRLKKPLAITMGCPVGIGPEIILRLFAEEGSEGQNNSFPVVIGDRSVLTWCAEQLTLPAPIVSWQPGDEVVAGSINVLEPGLTPLADLTDLSWGKPDLATGKAMAAYIETAVRFVSSGALAGMVTCPITKSALNNAGYQYPGHTEMLADLSGSSRYAMMMAGASLRVVLVTIHTALASVTDQLTTTAIYDLIELTARSLENDFAIDDPQIAVAGLNPHAGEDGLFGDEERQLIEPAVVRARNGGRQVSGPYPPDTVFVKAAAGDFDAVVCMYHDQGLIPFKLLHFADGVNVTLGLPIVRTSVDHGTAYDIAGAGLADPTSLREAIKMAATIASNRTRRAG